jgi:hypothetical protein
MYDDEGQQKIKELKAKYLEHDKNRGSLDYIQKDVSDEKKGEFFITQLNAHINRTSKDLNKMEDIITSNLKKGFHVIVKPELKDLLNKDYLKSKKDLKDNQNYLIKRVQQIVEEIKKEEKEKK